MERMTDERLSAFSTNDCDCDNESECPFQALCEDRDELSQALRAERERVEELEAELKATKLLEKEYRAKTADLQRQNNVKGEAINAALKLKRYDICSAAGMHFPLETDHGEWVKAKQLREAVGGGSDE